MRLEDLLSISNKMFERQSVVKTLWQTLAMHFNPMRADFTVTRSLGSEMGDHLLDSTPVLMARDLGDSIGSMMRDGSDFFEVDVLEEPDQEGKEWLQSGTHRLQRLFQDPRSGFRRATKQGDHDYATFGQCVLSMEPNRARNGLLVRNWHMRDCAWDDDETGEVRQVHRKWRPSVYDLKATFGDAGLSDQQREHLYKDPMKEIDVRHIVLPADMYGKADFERYKYVSIFIDMSEKRIIEEKGINYRYYIVPRFQTVAGSPYAYSPATVTGLPNARLLQAMTHTLMEAGERYARPPIIATSQVVRGDVDFGPDGITWVDKEYDEKLGAALRPMFQDRGGFPIGFEMKEGVAEILASAFYANRLSLPGVDHEMTAYEVAERMKQYRRENLPLFAPIESEYNGQLCETGFQLALDMGLMGSPYDIPKSLHGNEVEWKFKSPLTSSEEEKKVEMFKMNADLLSVAGQIDPSTRHNYDVNEAFRDAVEATGSPVTWLRDIREVQQLATSEAQLQAAQLALESDQVAA